MTHTPGPWVISRKATRRVTNLHGVVICNAVLRNQGGPNSTASIKSEVEAEANARLIAAAPALLAIAEQLEESLTADGYESVLVRDLRDAIALAKGESA